MSTGQVVPAGRGARPWLRNTVLRLALLGCAVLLLWFTLRTVSWAEVWAHLAAIEPWQLGLLFTANVLVILTFSLRWWLLLYAQGHSVPYRSLVGYRLASYAVSYVTPGPHFGGEPLQVYLVVARHQVPTPVAVAAVVLDKTIEMLANFAFLAAGTVFVLQAQVDLGPTVQRLLLVGVFVLLLLPVGVLVALGTGRHPLTGLLRLADAMWAQLTGRNARRGAGAMENTTGMETRPTHDGVVGPVRSPLLRMPGRLEGSAIYRTLVQSEAQGAQLCRERPLVLALALGASAISWIAIIGEFWLMTHALGLGLSLPGAITALVAARLAILLPLPAALGALEASQALAMRSLGLSTADGVSMSLLIRMRDVLFALVGLGLAAWYLGWGKSGKPRQDQSG